MAARSSQDAYNNTEYNSLLEKKQNLFGEKALLFIRNVLETCMEWNQKNNNHKKTDNSIHENSFQSDKIIIIFF